MIQIRVQLTAVVDCQADWLELSPDGHWLAIRTNDTWQMLDVLSGQTMHSFAISEKWVVVAPGGKLIASTPNSNVVSIFDIQKTRREIWMTHNVLDMIFSKKGEEFWVCMNDKHGLTKLALYNSSNLERLALIDIPMNKKFFDPQLLDSYESSIIVDRQSRMLAITRHSGDTYLGTVFLQTNNSHIDFMPYSIDADNGHDYIRSVRFPCFSTSSKYFATLDSPFLNIWNLLEMDKFITYTLVNQYEKIHGLTFVNDHLLIAVGDESNVLQIRLLQIKDTICVTIATIALPQPLVFSDQILQCFTMKAETLVGIHEDKILVYHIEQV